MKRLYAMGYAVGGVAIGDLNGDALPDLFFTSGPRENALYLQKKGGKLEFEEFAEAGVDGGDRWGTGAAMADIDNDGDPDLFLAMHDAPNQLWENLGEGLEGLWESLGKLLEGLEELWKSSGGLDI